MSTLYLVIFLGICFILSMVSLNAIYKRTNAYRNQFVDILKFNSISKKPNHSIDVVNIGSNAPKFAFDYSNISSLNCGNWAIGPETFEYDFLILRKFSEKLRKGATVILPICPGKFFLSKFKPMDSVVKYYSIFKQEEIPDYNVKQFICDYKYPLFFHPQCFKRILRDIRKDNRLALLRNPMERENVCQDASFWIEKCWNPEFDIDIENMKPLSDTNQRAVKFNIEKVRDICKFCKEHNFNLILVYLPLTKELGDKFSPEYIKTQLTNYVEDATRGYNIPLVDYMKDSRFTHYQYYINSFFMNRIGARKFTKIFIKENIN